MSYVTRSVHLMIIEKEQYGMVLTNCIILIASYKKIEIKPFAQRTEKMCLINYLLMSTHMKCL